MSNKNTSKPKSTAFHLSFFVKSIPETVEFYKTVTNTTPVKVKPDYAKFELSNPALVLSFIENPQKAAPSYGHAGIRVSSLSELKEHRERIEKAGLTVTEETDTNCCYARQDKFWVQDPAGFMWEFYYFHEDSEWTDPRTGKATCCSPVWVQQEEFLASKA